MIKHILLSESVGYFGLCNSVEAQFMVILCCYIKTHNQGDASVSGGSIGDQLKHNQHVVIYLLVYLFIYCSSEGQWENPQIAEQTESFG